jgi:hypothetical protein
LSIKRYSGSRKNDSQLIKHKMARNSQLTSQPSNSKKESNGEGTLPSECSGEDAGIDSRTN